ncbi:MAG: cyclic nucleotide-binding domain-containing protein [Myxococcales bacterium]|nr:cyclic nucleotide-binding domain-containing protein [Myxococcales bacterium]
MGTLRVEPSPPRVTEALSLAELDEIGLFGALDESVIAALAARLRVIKAEEGEVLYHEGDQGRVMLVVLEGELELSKICSDGTEQTMAILGPSDWCGEMSLLDVMARPVTARATKPSRLLAIGPPDLDAIYRTNVKAYALLMMNIARQLSRKLRSANQRMSERP